MARVVQKQENPLLFVLVIFIFLFVVSAALAVLFLNQATEAEDKLATRNKTLSTLASPSDMNLPVVKSLMKAAGRSGGKSVVAALNNESIKLGTLISGDVISVEDAMKAYDTLHKNMVDMYGIKDKRGWLLGDVLGAYTALTEAKTQIATLNEQIKSLTKNVGDKSSEISKARNAFDAEIATLSKEKSTLATSLSAAQALRIKELKTASDQGLKIDRKKRKEIEGLKRRINALSIQIKLKDAQIKLLSKPEGTGSGLALGPKSAGQIVDIMTDIPVCFIPLGKEDNIVRGMTFRIYSPAGIPADGTGHKASITVTRVLPKNSQCRIEQAHGQKPVAIGDLFMNIAYDRTHTRVFVVNGRFDLFGTGYARNNSAKRQIVNIIERSGGKVTEEVSYKTDFVLLGEKPLMPDAPGEDDEEHVRMAYARQLKKLKEYNDVLEKAQKLRIEVINIKRFLALSGYDPAKTLK